MGFNNYGLPTLDTANQAYRVPGLAVDSIRLKSLAGSPDTTNEKYRVHYDIIRALAFIGAGDGRPYGRQYLAKIFDAELTEFPGYALSAGGTPTPFVGAAMVPAGRGLTHPFGMELTGAGYTAVDSNYPPKAPSRFKKISLHVRTDELMAGDGSLDEVFQLQLQMAAVSLVRSLSLAIFQSQLTVADDNPNIEFLGLPGYMLFSPFGDQTVPYPTTGTSYPMLTGLNNIEALCHPSDGHFGAGPDVFVMSSRARWRLIRELQVIGSQPDFAPCALAGGRRVLHFNGVPVLQGRVIESTDGSDAWALKLSGPSGIHVRHVGGDSSTFGIRHENAATVPQSAPGGSQPPNEVINASRGIEVFGVYSLVVPEIQSVARLTGIDNDVPAYPLLPSP